MAPRKSVRRKKDPVEVEVAQSTAAETESGSQQQLNGGDNDDAVEVTAAAPSSGNDAEQDVGVKRKKTEAGGTAGESGGVSGVLAPPNVVEKRKKWEFEKLRS